jgi:tRNA G10  N-methylase Trm11
VLPRWADRVRPGGRVVVIVPGPIAPPGPEWTSVVRASVRVHRSLTREFRVFERTGAT